MNSIMKLSTITDNEGKVDFIANKTKNNYINLGGANDKNTIDCVHAFLCYYGVWDTTDYVIVTRKPINFKPDIKYHDISFVLVFYNAACKSREAKMQQQIIEQDTSNKESKESINKEPHDSRQELESKNTETSNQQIIVKTLTNPNISHDTSSRHDNRKEDNSQSSKNIDKDLYQNSKDLQVSTNAKKHYKMIEESDSSDSSDSIECLLDSPKSQTKGQKKIEKEKRLSNYSENDDNSEFDDSITDDINTDDDSYVDDTDSDISSNTQHSTNSSENDDETDNGKNETDLSDENDSSESIKVELKKCNKDSDKKGKNKKISSATKSSKTINVGLSKQNKIDNVNKVSNIKQKKKSDKLDPVGIEKMEQNKSSKNAKSKEFSTRSPKTKAKIEKSKKPIYGSKTSKAPVSKKTIGKK